MNQLSTGRHRRQRKASIVEDLINASKKFTQIENTIINTVNIQFPPFFMSKPPTNNNKRLKDETQHNSLPQAGKSSSNFAPHQDLVLDALDVVERTYWTDIRYFESSRCKNCGKQGQAKVCFKKSTKVVQLYRNIKGSDTLMRKEEMSLCQGRRRVLQFSANSSSIINFSSL